MTIPIFSGLKIGLLKNKVNSLVTILSLCTGLTVFFLIMLYVQHEFTWNRSWPDADNIYRLLIDQENPGTGVYGIYDSTHNSVLGDLKRHFPDVINTGARSKTTFVSYVLEGVEKSTNLTIADSSFIDIFKLEVLAGDLNFVMSNPGILAISESVADELPFDSPIGSRITFRNFQGVEMEFEIGAIIRPQDHISNAYEFNLLALMDEGNSPLFSFQNSTDPEQWMNGSRIWMQLRENTNPDELTSRLREFVDIEVPVFRAQLAEGQKVSDFIQYRFQPISQMYMNPITTFTNNSGQYARTLTFAAVAILVLLVGIANAVSLNLASVLERRREIGIRKASGANNVDIAIQYLSENIIIILIALAPTLLFVNLLRVPFETMLSIRELTPPGIDQYLMMTVIALVTGLMSALYPTLVLSRTTPNNALKSESSLRKTRTITLRNALVGSQFLFALILLISTFGLFTQLDVTRNQPLGYNPENLVLIYLGPENRGKNSPALRQELNSIPGVVGVAAITSIPNQNLANLNMQAIVRAEDQQNVVGIEPASSGYDFFQLIQVPLLAGRFFDPARDGNITSYETYIEQDRGVPKMLLNRSAVEALGFNSSENAVGETIYIRNENQQTRELQHFPREIIGVVDDSMYLSLRKIPGPEMYSPVFDEFSQTILMKFESTIAGSIQDSVTQVWEEVIGSPPAGMVFVEERLSQEYIQVEGESRLLLAAAGLAIFLSCIGLFGFAAFTMQRSIKEIGVRKALGATTPSVIKLYLWRFSKPILIANIIAWPSAIYFILQWIERFPYQIDKAWLLPLCLAGTLLVLTIAILTISGVTAKAAMANPVKSLRYE